MADNSKFYFAKSHEWISLDSNNVYNLGISDFAQSELGDVVYVQLPEVGKQYKKDEKIGEIESVKSVSEIYAPADLTIKGVNSKLNETPELINNEPLGEGFIAQIELNNPSDLSSLMDKNSYESFVKSNHE
ncbi:MAG: glycine cleavage system protein GcvH [Candidatus Acididesulfobacter guangdongensis]|uniref:Glycine cleavage system H protein n=1 Tax=Acididesulfobacter guangdongensis TaxID=2597225 RepID=A0A519BF65_ACIG2|nr:MAG: glycine cleavage system protein GcvH [Candidatus Acididesulfobacter guangdongensis]